MQAWCNFCNASENERILASVNGVSSILEYAVFILDIIIWQNHYLADFGDLCMADITP